MNATAKYILMIGAMGVLSSCTPPNIDIFVEKDAGQLHLTLSQDWGLVFSDKQTPCVREIALHDPKNLERNSAAWLIQTKGDVQCLDLARVRVGDVPKGWQQLIPISAVRGRTYSVKVQGIGWGEADISF